MEDAAGGPPPGDMYEYVFLDESGRILGEFEPLGQLLAEVQQGQPAAETLKLNMVVDKVGDTLVIQLPRELL